MKCRYKAVCCTRVLCLHCTGNTALHLSCSAAGSGMADVVNALIEKGASVWATDRQGYTALQRACQHDHASIARMLIVQTDASPHQRVPHNGNVPLHLAAEHGHINTVQVSTLYKAKAKAKAETECIAYRSSGNFYLTLTGIS